MHPCAAFTRATSRSDPTRCGRCSAFPLQGTGTPAIAAHILVWTRSSSAAPIARRTRSTGAPSRSRSAASSSNAVTAANSSAVICAHQRERGEPRRVSSNPSCERATLPAPLQSIGPKQIRCSSSRTSPSSMAHSGFAESASASWSSKAPGRRRSSVKTLATGIRLRSSPNSPSKTHSSSSLSRSKRQESTSPGGPSTTPSEHTSRQSDDAPNALGATALSSSNASLRWRPRVCSSSPSGHAGHAAASGRYASATVPMTSRRFTSWWCPRRTQRSSSDRRGSLRGFERHQ